MVEGAFFTDEEIKLTIFHVQCIVHDWSEAVQILEVVLSVRNFSTVKNVSIRIKNEDI